MQGVCAIVFLTGATSLADCRSREPVSPSAQLVSAVEAPRGPDLGRGASRVKVET
jgi:hypothetical protein